MVKNCIFTAVADKDCRKTLPICKKAAIIWLQSARKSATVADPDGRKTITTCRKATSIWQKTAGKACNFFCVSIAIFLKFYGIQLQIFFPYNLKWLLCLNGIFRGVAHFHFKDNMENSVKSSG